jgi:hypothetical protein
MEIQKYMHTTQFICLKNNKTYRKREQNIQFVSHVTLQLLFKKILTAFNELQREEYKLQPSLIILIFKNVWLKFIFVLQRSNFLLQFPIHYSQLIT